MKITSRSSWAFCSLREKVRCIFYIELEFWYLIFYTLFSCALCCDVQRIDYSIGRQINNPFLSISRLIFLLKEDTDSNRLPLQKSQTDTETTEYILSWGLFERAESSRSLESHQVDNRPICLRSAHCEILYSWPSIFKFLLIGEALNLKYLSKTQYCLHFMQSTFECTRLSRLGATRSTQWVETHRQTSVLKLFHYYCEII